MGKKIKIINRESRDLIGIVEQERFTRFPMIGEWVEYAKELFVITNIAHGSDEDVLLVLSPQNDLLIR